MLNELLDEIKSVETNDLKLYFITRTLKEGISKRAKVLDKYSFNLYQVDVNSEIREHLHELTIEQLEYLHKKDYEIQDYDVISEDTDQIFTYQMQNKAMAFADVINNKLPNKSQINKVHNIESLVLDEDLWAYSVGFDNEGDWIYSFRKIIKSKVAIDETEGNQKSTRQKIIRTIFNTNSNKLELIHGETVNLDKQIDCVYYNDAFYIFKKTNFEQITGLTEEFKVEAENIVTELEASDMIEGVDIIAEEVAKNPSIHKKLVRLQKIGNYQNLTTDSLLKMKEVAETFGETLKSKNGKILIEEKKDIDTALKMLCDYYKEGKVSGKDYGTYAGKQLTHQN
nr:Kiwa anti-phage protein KwaB-like domain-containing protein [uncultured Draconibacterium sp.]